MKKIFLSLIAFSLAFSMINFEVFNTAKAEEVSPEVTEEKSLEKLEMLYDEYFYQATLENRDFDLGYGYVNGEGEFVDPTEELTDEEFESISDFSEIVTEDSQLADEDSLIQARIPAFLAPIVVALIRQALVALGKKSAMRNFTKHALERGGTRRIKEKWVADTLAHGKPFVDKKSGAQILWDKKTGTTLVMTNNGKTVKTMYRQDVPKKIWKAK